MKSSHYLPKKSTCFITKHMDPVYREAKQTRGLVFGARKGLLQGHASRQMVHTPPDSELSETF